MTTDGRLGVGSREGARSSAEPGFSHEAMFYRDEAAFVGGCTEFIEAGLEADEAVLVVVPAHKIPWLREALNGSAGEVDFIDMADVGANPARIIPAWHAFVTEQSARGRAFRGIGEPIFPGRTEAQLAECRRHEALLNVAFEGSGAWRLLCPYDTSALPASLISEAKRTHPYVVAGGHPQPSGEYPGTSMFAAPFEEELPDPPVIASWVDFGADDLSHVRRFVTDRCYEARLDREQRDAMILAVNEIATNSLRHGGGGGRVRSWVEDGTLICEVSDGGNLRDPLAGRKSPDTDSSGGRGLWMVNHLCDLVQQRSIGDGTVTRLHMQGAQGTR